MKSQAQALIKEGIKVDFFLIKKNGVFGYLKSIRELIHYSKSREYDIYHAHYSFSGYVASLAKKKPLVVSLLGTDVIKSSLSRSILKIVSSICDWSRIIVKSDQMKNLLKIKLDSPQTYKKQKRSFGTKTANKVDKILGTGNVSRSRRRNK